MRAKIDPIGLAVLLTYDDRDPTPTDCDLIIGAIHFELADDGLNTAMNAMASLVHCINHNPGFFTPKRIIDHAR